MNSESCCVCGKYRILLLAAVVYITWLIATYLLEGRILTLLRPEAVVDRVLYTVIANISVGSILALRVIRQARESNTITLDSSGFRPARRTIIAILIAFILGLLVLVFQNPASLDPVILLNVYAQVFTVTIAEIAVCWVVIGSIIEGYVKNKGKIIAIVCGIIAASILFGIYHIGHSPPFNQPETIAFLSVIGVVTSLVYFIGRDVYATMIFHNFFGSIGVLQSLTTGGVLENYTKPQFPLIGMAIISLIIFIAVDLLYVRRNGVS